MAPTTETNDATTNPTVIVLTDAAIKATDLIPAMMIMRMITTTVAVVGMETPVAIQKRRNVVGNIAVMAAAITIMTTVAVAAIAAAIMATATTAMRVMDAAGTAIPAVIPKPHNAAGKIAVMATAITITMIVVDVEMVAEMAVTETTTAMAVAGMVIPGVIQKLHNKVGNIAVTIITAAIALITAATAMVATEPAATAAIATPAVVVVREAGSAIQKGILAPLVRAGSKMVTTVMMISTTAVIAAVDIKEACV